MSLSKSKKLILGLTAVSGVVTFYYLNNTCKVQNSWTTNYNPSPFAKWDENWDHRCPKYMNRIKGRRLSETEENTLNEQTEKKPTAVRHIILIRHGQYNLNGTTDGERVLTKLGRMQAEYTGKRLKELDLPYTQMVKSTMTRAQETGTIISEYIPEIPVLHCDLLREGAPIPPEPPVGTWKPENYFYQDGSRIEAAFRKYFHRADCSQEKDSYTVLVCHANVIRYFVCRALQFPAEAWLRLSINHASITWISITPSGRCILRVLGDTGHMPPNVITST
ncbi:serine/threonine-protein phosphatase PGAM5, mitochondrial-like isoform X2 [Diorhabda carinulata]|uniref:serine/threonine-protein phosphatase PGAM5, mitochondrial-like isoform X2 n=1 Tax=Diorhabda sublineata TaxID=1163346 RepID=UPI0024E0A091|nr:serine/threonine-protein phosphatase PGAM5, mitochondrial-like isoform X2 [Diorhabda sublineata]XP_057659246.1 serine/threonine-protein phosphatase PGAM5, mitochondrial-like isoform X2 [Diorhabda carinulata]